MLSPSIRFEVFQDHLADNKAGISKIDGHGDDLRLSAGCFAGSQVSDQDHLLRCVEAQRWGEGTEPPPPASCVTRTPRVTTDILSAILIATGNATSAEGILKLLSHKKHE